jgi:GNAT superfamily N-acetyltransferase
MGQRTRRRPTEGETDTRARARESERVEAEAWAQLQSALPEAFRARMGIEVYRDGGSSTLITRGTTELAVNRVIALGVVTPATSALVDTIMARFRDAGVDRYLVHLSPDAEPAELRAWLLERGFVERPGLAALVRDTSVDVGLELPDGLRIEEIGERDAALFRALVAEPLRVPEEVRLGITSTIGHPGWRFYLAYRGDLPIAGAAMYSDGPAAWGGLTATVEGARGQGTQSALLARRIHDAAAMGARWLTAETLPERPERRNASLKNMQRLGFHLMYERPNFVFGAQADATPT